MYKWLDKNKRSLVTRGNLSVQYSEKKMVSSPLARFGYGLFVFDDLYNATHSDLGISDSQLWLVKVERVHDEIPPELSSCFLDKLEVCEKLSRRVLDELGQKIELYLLDCPWPTGTVMVDRVQLVRQVVIDQIIRDY
jgi:hypothetical protein